MIMVAMRTPCYPRRCCSHLSPPPQHDEVIRPCSTTKTHSMYRDLQLLERTVCIIAPPLENEVSYSAAAPPLLGPADQSVRLPCSIPFLAEVHCGKMSACGHTPHGVWHLSTGQHVPRLQIHQIVFMCSMHSHGCVHPMCPMQSRGCAPCADRMGYSFHAACAFPYPEQCCQVSHYCSDAQSHSQAPAHM